MSDATFTGSMLLAESDLTALSIIAASDTLYAQDLYHRHGGSPEKVLVCSASLPVPNMIVMALTGSEVSQQQYCL